MKTGGGGDVVAIGEVMIRLAPDPGVRLENAGRLNVEMGGTECNVMVGLSSLGRRCAWISKLADNELGRMVYRRVRETGVDVSRVVWARGARSGTYFVEFGMRPRPSKIIYDRKNSAASLLKAEDVDWEFLTGFELASALRKADEMGLDLILAISDRESSITYYRSRKIKLPRSRNNYYEIEWVQP